MPSPGSMLITPGGSPASSSSSMVSEAASCWVGDGFQIDGVAHQRRRGGQVAGDRGEVERRDRVDEPLERPVVGAVPHARAVGDGLVGEDLLGVVDVVAPEVDELAGGVDLGLERRLGLAEHRGGVDPLPPRPGQQVGGLQQHRAPVVHVQRPPVVRRVGRGLDRGPGVGLGRALEPAQHVLVVVRLHDRELRPAAGPAAATDVGLDVLLAPLELLDLDAQGLPFGVAGRVGQVRLVRGSRREGDGVHASDTIRRAARRSPGWRTTPGPRPGRRRPAAPRGPRAPRRRPAAGTAPSGSATSATTTTRRPGPSSSAAASAAAAIRAAYSSSSESPSATYRSAEAGRVPSSLSRASPARVRGEVDPHAPHDLGADFFRRPRGTLGRPPVAVSSSSVRASVTHWPRTSASGTRSRSAVMP